MSLIYDTEHVKIMCFDKVILDVKENRFYSPTCAMDDNNYTIQITHKEEITMTGRFLHINESLYTSVLDSCYTHAIWDNMLIVYYVLSRIQKKWNVDKSRFNFFIRDKEIIKYPHNVNLLDESASSYKGMWQWLNNRITDKPLLFQHLLAKQGVDYVVFNKLYTVNAKTMKQITPWKDYVIGPNRIFNTPMTYSDEQRCKIISEFKHFVNPRDLIVKKAGRKFLIINRQRKGTNAARVIFDDVLAKITTVMKSNGFESHGMVYMEDMTLDERIELFKTVDIVISPRSSCSANVLWMYDIDYITITLGDDKICNNEESLFSYHDSVRYHHYIDDMRDTSHWDTPIFKMNETHFDEYIKDRFDIAQRASPAPHTAPTHTQHPVHHNRHSPRRRNLLGSYLLRVRRPVSVVFQSFYCLFSTTMKVRY